MNRHIETLRVRRFSCLAIVMTMLLFGASSGLEAMTALTKFGEEAAADSLARMGNKFATEADVTAFAKTMATAATDSLTAIATKYGFKTVDEGVANAAMQAEVKGVMDTMAQGVAKLEGVGVKAADVSPSALTKLASGSVEDFDKAIDSMTEQLDEHGNVIGSGKITKAQAGTLKQEFAQSKEALAGQGKVTASATVSATASKSTSIEQMVSKQFSGTSGGLAKIMGKTTASAEKDALLKEFEASTTTMARKEAITKEINEIEYAASTIPGKALRRLNAASSPLLKALEYGGMTMTAAVLFMIPSIFQSAFLAQQAQNALLQTYIPPIKFGNIVLQLPDSVINMDNPAMSQFIYYGIPVSNPGDNLSAAAKAAYPGVSNPTANNKISAGVKNGYARLFSAGATKKIAIPRYNLDASALASLPVFVSYSSQSYIPWASNGIPDAAFSQTMINLNTGYVFYADGTSQGTAPAPLVNAPAAGGGAAAATVQSFMATELGKLSTTGTQATYTQYVQAYKSAKASAVSSPLAAQFNCACLEANNGVLSGATIKACGSSSCLLTSALNQLAAGLVIDANGKELQPGETLAGEVAKGALGQVIPIQGLDSSLNSILQMFPGAQQNALANSGALTVSLGSNLSAATAPKIQGAPADNYSAKGVYVYQCKNTPLAKILRNQSGGSAAVNSQITDYIVFLDANLNQVPMMAPVQDPTNYNFIRMGLNPEIAYFSTIIGNIDSTGAFSFLPQLNIQSPAALIAKGLPATFAPLYGLTATNGSLAVNYNQNLTSVIGTIATALASNAKLGQQFKAMQSAMLGALTAGPYGKYALNPVDVTMQPSIGGVHLITYTGFNSYPVSQDQANAACTDVLIPLSAQGKTVTLPSNNVTQYYGLVTDLTYTVLADGSITVGAAGFANSPLSATGTINQTKVSQFYWMSKLTAMGQSNDPQFVMPPALVSFVTAARSAWVSWLQAASKSGLSMAEFNGVAVTGTPSILTIASQQALQNGLYIYTCAPCPSSLATQDYFVLTNSATPQASDTTLGTMSATKATSATNMLSLISGSLYSLSGTQVTSGSGAAYSVSATTLLTTLNTANPQAMSNDLKVKLNISVGQAATTAAAMTYPFSFGSLQLGLYNADASANVYLYFNAAGAGTSASFQPSDYFVTVDSYTSPSTIQAQLSATTAFMVSLVSGQVYGPTGVVATMPASLVSQIIATLSPQWRSGVAAQITTLTAALSTAAQTNTQQTAAMNNAAVPSTGIITWPQASAMQIITAISSLNPLADPYGMLKQDPTSGMYVLITPATADGTQSLYTFFNVPSSVVDVNGNPVNVGATYDGQANLLRSIQGIELTSMMHQCGVVIDSTGKQYLGANNSLPIMQLDPADLALKPGVSGKSMIVSTDPNFPSHAIVSPISYANSTFYIYYNTITQGYYAMQINGSDTRYIDMAGGNVYNLNGSPRLALNPVAVNSNGDLTDLFLPYLNPDGFTRCVMKNADNNGMYSGFLNSETDFQAFATDVATNNPCGLNTLYSLDAVASSATMAQMPFPATLTAMPDLTVANQYNVYFDQLTTPVTYMVNPTYQWQNLQILPINMTTRALLNPLPDPMYSNASLVSTSNGMFAMVFANQFYSNAQQAGANSYTMTSVAGPTGPAGSIAVSMQTDAKTNTQYVQVIAAGITYNYQCSFLTLPDTTLTDYLTNGWQANIVADVRGNILLEAYITASAGNLMLVPVSIGSVKNVPTDPTAKSALAAGLANIMQDSGNGRFVSPVAATTYPYFTQAGYVDLEDGALFDATGVVLGFTLQYADLLNLLSSLSVAVTRDANNKAILTYRAPLLAPAVNSGASTLSSSYVPTASAAPAATVSAPTYSSGLTSTQSPSVAPTYVQTTAPVQAYFPATVAQASAVTYTSAPAASAPSPASMQIAPVAQAPVQAAPMSSSNPQVATLQQQNVALQADMASRNNALKTEKVAHRRQVLQNAILTDQQQIALDNQQISALSTASSARSNVLGRYSSQPKKKATAVVKKSKK